MDETTQQNAAVVEEAAASSRAIVDQMRALNELISRYQLDSSTDRGQAPSRRVAPSQGEAPGRKAA
jgi:methyl-accepting chemotaxis protein